MAPQHFTQIPLVFSCGSTPQGCPPDRRKRDPALKFILRHQLFAVIAELVATRDTKVARLQFEHDVGKNAQFEVTAIDAANRSPLIFIPGDKRPPFVGYERQIQLLLQQQP